MIDSRKLFPNTTVAEILTLAIDACPKTQKEIAEEVGFPNPNVITMIKQGKTPLPINRIGPLAKAVGLDPAFLLRLTFQEYYPDTWATLEEHLGDSLMTHRERELIKRWRNFTYNMDPSVALVRDLPSIARMALIVPLDVF
jgi:transcriptional regulator with XRE-family HTH domain